MVSVDISATAVEKLVGVDITTDDEISITSVENLVSVDASNDVEVDTAAVEKLIREDNANTGDEIGTTVVGNESGVNNTPSNVKRLV